MSCRVNVEDNNCIIVAAMCYVMVVIYNQSVVELPPMSSRINVDVDDNNCIVTAMCYVLVVIYNQSVVESPPYQVGLTTALLQLQCVMCWW